MATCYDQYIRNKLNRQNLCLGCSNFNGLVIKKKSQIHMGYRYQCKGIPPPSPIMYRNDIPTSPPRTIVRFSPKRSVRPRFSPRRHFRFNNHGSVDNNNPPSHDAELKSCYSSDCESDEVSRISFSADDSVIGLISPPRKVTRSTNSSNVVAKRHVKAPTIFCPSPFRRKRSCSRHSVDLSPRDTVNLRDAVSVNDQMIQQLNHEREFRLRLQSQLQSANHKINLLQKDCDKLRLEKAKSRSPTLNSSSSNRSCNAVSKLFTELLRSNTTTEEVIHGVLQAILKRSRMCKALNQSIINNAELFSPVSDFFQQKMYNELRYKFRPWICLQQLDMAATVSFRAYDTIRLVEFAEDDNKKYRRGLFHSRHKLSRICRQLESHGANLLPYTVTENAVKFDVKAASKFLLDRHGLWDLVLNKEQVRLAATVDGGELSWNVTQVSAGIKIVDDRALDPLSGLPLFGHSGHDRIQSKFHCYPLYVIIGKDNKHLYRTHLSTFFDDISSFEVQNAGGLQVAQCHDMCSLHKALGVGGGMKVKLLACYCCNRHRDDLAKPMDEPCVDCIRLQRTQPCYHTTISDEEMILRMREERDEQLNTYPHLRNVPFNGRSRLRCGTDNDVSTVITPDRDPLHIQFQPTSRMEREEQRKLLKNELLIRNLLHLSNLPTAQIVIHLHEILLIEKTFLSLDYVVNAKTFDDAMIRLEQALPCLLHLENRTSEAIIEHLLRRGVRLREGNSASTLEFISSVESVMNSDIFGSLGCSSLWSFPLNADGTVGKVKLANWRARKVIQDFEILIDLCLAGDTLHDERNQWMRILTSYRLCIKALQQKTDFSESDIDNFQCVADSFFWNWINVTGYDGITNYIHMLGAGYIRYFLRKWKNLNRFQNQGWEAYNGMIAAFWHHRTRKGGGKYISQRSQILPIARWILRVMLWRTGEAQRYFRSLDEELDLSDGDSYSSSDSDD